MNDRNMESLGDRQGKSDNSWTEEICAQKDKSDESIIYLDEDQGGFYFECYFRKWCSWIYLTWWRKRGHTFHWTGVRLVSLSLFCINVPYLMLYRLLNPKNHGFQFRYDWIGMFVSVFVVWCRPSCSISLHSVK